MNTGVAVLKKPAKGPFGSMVSHLRSRGIRAGAVNLTRTLLYPFVRHSRRLIWEVDLRQVRPPSQWDAGKRVFVLGPDNPEITPQLRAFLGGDTVAAEIAGVHQGDRLFIVANETEYLAYSYIFFDTTRETRRQARILGETPGTPIIGLSHTAPGARGRGLYRRLLNEMFRFLQNMGYERAVCEVDPANIASNKASQAAGMRICRELSDWTVLRRLVVQKVRQSGRTRWRRLLVS